MQQVLINIARNSIDAMREVDGRERILVIRTVVSDGSTITVDENITARAGDVNTVAFLTQEAKGTITATSYYKGDSIKQTHRLDKDRSFDFDINAIDPAFEKALAEEGIAEDASAWPVY